MSVSARSKMQVFSALVMNSCYSQIEIEDTDHDKTAFTSLQRLYGFAHFLFDLKYVTTTFRQVSNVLLARIKNVVRTDLPLRHITFFKVARGLQLKCKVNTDPIDTSNSDDTVEEMCFLYELQRLSCPLYTLWTIKCR